MYLNGFHTSLYNFNKFNKFLFVVQKLAQKSIRKRNYIVNECWGEF